MMAQRRLRALAKQLEGQKRQFEEGTAQLRRDKETLLARHAGSVARARVRARSGEG